MSTRTLEIMPRQGSQDSARDLSDPELVDRCLRGDQDAWSALLHKYKNLIYSVPLKYGASRDDAADIYQGVALELFNELPRLREVGALTGWLITVTVRKCFRWKQAQQCRAEDDLEDLDQLAEDAMVPPELLEELEREQMVRQGVAELPERCQQMIRLLFYENPPRSYQEVAKALGLAPDSIGFIRGRCLKRLQQVLEKMGFGESAYR